MIRSFIEKVHKRFSRFSQGNFYDDDEFDEVSSMMVPSDVHEGHFAVMAMKGSEKKRFIVKIECLNSPEFVKLLEQSEEEYGFGQTGTLVVPCTPQELEKILSM